jgi:hypothetical protein
MIPKLYILLHIYKAGGQTINHQIQLNLRHPAALPLHVGAMQLDISKATGSPANPGWISDRVFAHVAQNLRPVTRVAYGHMAYYGLHRQVTWSVEPRYVVFLRDPVERIISLYYYLRDISKNYWHYEITEARWDLEAWLEKSRALWHHNGQVRQLLIGTDDSVSTDRELTSEHLETAKRHLRSFWFVGLTQTFRPDAYYLYGKLGLRKFTADDRINANPNKPEVSPELRRSIAEQNLLDVELYEEACRQRSAWRRAHAAEYWANERLTTFRRHINNGIWGFLIAASPSWCC